MTKKEIFDIEKVNYQRIYLFLEGTFWKAYEKSAFHFVKAVRPYKTVKRVVKNLGEEVVSLGFPRSALSDIKESTLIEIIKESEKKLIFKAPEKIIEEEFLYWKSNILLTIPSNQKVNYKTHASAVSDDILTTDIIMKINQFQIESKTPLECMFFVSELKKITSTNALQSTTGI